MVESIERVMEGVGWVWNFTDCLLRLTGFCWIFADLNFRLVGGVGARDCEGVFPMDVRVGEGEHKR